MSFRMYHPEIEATAECPSEEAFQQAWEHLGWRPLKPEFAFAQDILGHAVRTNDDLKVDDLKRLIRYRGYELPSGNKKADFEAAYLSTFGDEPVTDPADDVRPPTEGFVPDANNPARSVDAELPDTSGLPVQPQEI